MTTPDFYHIDDRRLAAYFEKEWFDQVIAQGLDRSFKTEFPRFPSQALYCDYHEKFVAFVQQHLAAQDLQPKALLEVGASLGRTFYEVCRRIPSIRQATLLEPSRKFREAFDQLFAQNGIAELPVLSGNRGVSHVRLNPEAIRKECSHVDYRLVGHCYEDAKGLPAHDLVLCSNVIDQCAEPRKLVEFLQNHTAPGGVLALSCTYQWKKNFVDLKQDFIPDVKELFGPDWRLLGETELEYRVRGNERHWLTFMSQVLVFASPH